jgi:hypothetical protein
MTQKITTTGRTIAANVTRPNDTTAYTAGDVLCDSTSAPTILTFTGATKEQGGTGTIVGATCIDSAAQATKPDLELWLFDTAITMDNDNAAFTPTDAELRTLVGVISFPVASFKVGDATSGADGNCVCDVQTLGVQVNTVVGSNALYGVLVVRNAYTPVANERFDVRLKIKD